MAVSCGVNIATRLVVDSSASWPIFADTANTRPRQT